MEKNTGKSFEELVQNLYQSIVDLEDNGYRKIRVERDVKITGKSGVKHQIDVYWECELFGITHKTIIEVKDWKNKVKKEQIMSFYEKLQDIQGLPMGIFVAKNGFQQGAIDYASFHGIKLASIVDSGIMNHLYMTFIFRYLQIENFQIKFNKEWEKQQDIPKGFGFSGTFGEFELCNDHGKRERLYDLAIEALEKQKDIPDYFISSIDVKFNENKYLLTNREIVPKILIDGFSYDYYYVTTQIKRELHAKEETKYLLTYLLENKSTRFNKDMHIIL